MVARDPQVSAHKGYRQHQETQDGEPGGPAAPPAHGEPLVQQHRIDQPAIRVRTSSGSQDQKRPRVCWAYKEPVMMPPVNNGKPMVRHQ